MKHYRNQNQNLVSDLPPWLIDKIKLRPFWIEDLDDHRIQHERFEGECCFNHIVGLPIKHGRHLRMFDYEMELFRAYKQYRYVWVLKATGLGVSEFSLRYMAFMACAYKDIRYKDSQMAIVVGPNKNLATRLIKRLKDIFYNDLGLLFDTNENQVFINNIDISAYPSHNVHAFRSLSNPSFILIDEGDFFPPGQQIEVRHASERYVGKSDATIALVSTPNVPGGLMESIEKETESLYYRIKLPYTVGLNKIFSIEDIERAKRSPSFEREYSLKYGFDVGNILSSQSVADAISLSQRYPAANYNIDYTHRSMGIDPAYANSKFAIVITEWLPLDPHHTAYAIRVMYSVEHVKPEFGDMVNEAFRLIQRYHVNKIYIDGSQPEFIRAIKILAGENKDYESLVQRAQKMKQQLHHYMDIIPVQFNAEGRNMIDNMRQWFEARRQIMINEEDNPDLVTQLRVAKQKADGKLDKLAYSLDLFDALRMSLLYYRFDQE